MKTSVLAFVCLLILPHVATAIPPAPGLDLLETEQISYFRIRPDYIDLAMSPPGARAFGVVRAVVLLIDFDDFSVQYPEHNSSYFEYKLFSSDRGSMRTYFEENSYGRFTITGDVFGWYRSSCSYRDIVNRDRTPFTKDDYGLDTSPDAIDSARCSFPLNIWGIVAEAVHLADDEVDFSLYDNDGPDGIPSSGDDDGFVDALFVIHPGIGAEHPAASPNREDYIWSLQSSLDYYTPTKGTSADGVKIGQFIIVPELGEIGVFAHEFCHILGLPDLYDPSRGNGGMSVVGMMCLMDAGAWGGPQHALGSVPSHLCAPMKYVLGWINPFRVCLACGDSSIVTGAEFPPCEILPVAFEIMYNPGGMDWNPSGKGRGEYFLVENRRKGVRYFDSYLPGSGLLIWKVDESRPDNTDPDHLLVELIQADGEDDIPGEDSDFWPGSLDKTEFTPYTNPPSSLSDGKYTGVSIENITEHFGGLVTADIRTGIPKRGNCYAFPNPFRPGIDPFVRICFVPEIGPAKPLSFKGLIFDIEGNIVRKLEGTEVVLEEGAALWDGKDINGNYVQSGLYFYFVESSGQTGTGVIGVKAKP